MQLQRPAFRGQPTVSGGEVHFGQLHPNARARWLRHSGGTLYLRMLVLRLFTLLTAACLSFSIASAASTASRLPAAYFRLMEAGAKQVEQRLDAEPTPDFAALETSPAWKHFPYAILAPAVLYAKRHPSNSHYHDPKMLALAIRIGDLLASEDEKGVFEPRLDSDWDTYMWLEAYRLLERDLGPERRERWQQHILRNVALVEHDAAERVDFPWYNSPYIGTSPNHYAQYASLLFLAGRTFRHPDWQALGARILHRFAAVEQTPDGYWGEHSRMGPTTGYDHLTMTQVALYYEYTKDPAALRALRRSTSFHENFTYLDGTPVEVINDRNRYWDVDTWGQFGFSNFADGRRYAEFLTSFLRPDDLHIDWLGRLSQDALYYHEGPTAPIPQDQPRYSYRMTIPAGIRKTRPWVVCLSGIVDTPAVNNQYYLDRQASLSVFHERLGLIISGANSKRQPELATFSEKLSGEVYHTPLSSRLQMSDKEDRLSLAFNTFFSDLYVPAPTEDELTLRFVITGKGTPAEEPRLTLQLCLKPGEELETATGQKFRLGDARLELGPDALGGWIRHHGWTMKFDSTARLVWPIRPYNPYQAAPETGLEHAVGALSVPLRLKSKSGFVRPDEQEIVFSLAAH
ncbi:MAG TPA: hypothetical protein VG204_13365 [Terriglobia bacterium]|nr:hypothetical protein [Terriglobia bacterium]